MKVFDGAKMRAIRKEAELTQYDLAPMVGISQNRVSDIERNVTTPTNEEIEAFADALNTQVSSFLSNESEIEVIANTFTKKKKDTENHYKPQVAKLEQQVEELKNRKPVIIYQVDNAGGELIGTVTDKAIVDGHYTVTIGAYGKFLVTKEQYESINVGDDAPGYLKK